MQPEQMIPDEKNTVTLNGITVRKGSVAAFMANIEIIEREKSNSDIYQEALTDLLSLIPVIEGTGFFRLFTIKSARIREIIEAEKLQT